MKFTMTKIAALAAMAFASTGAHAALSSTNTLSIQNDAVTSFNASNSSWTVSSNGALADSYFTMGGNKEKLYLDTQYAYISAPRPLTLNGAVQKTVGTYYWYTEGSVGTNSIGGVSILTASGDNATLNMSNWKFDFSGVLDIPLGNGAWSDGYVDGVGNLTCTIGSGCAAGSAYTLKYTATVPMGDSSGFGGLQYYLELHGEVGAVPEASTYAMMLAGLGLVGFMARRRKQTRT